MSSSRRSFLERFAATAAVAAGYGAAPRSSTNPMTLPSRSERFDMSWLDRVRGRFRGVFDGPRLDGMAIERAGSWGDQLAEVWNAEDDEITAVLVIRHHGIPLIMNDAFWSRHQVGRKYNVRDPRNGKIATANPIRAAAPDAQPASASTTLEGFMQRGGIVLACNIAFEFMVALEREADRRAVGDPRERALAGVIPGIILQPSGYFAILEAQRAGCHLFAAGE